MMSISEKVLDALRAGILLNGRLTTFLGKVEHIDHDLRKISGTLIRLETMVQIARNKKRGHPAKAPFFSFFI
jgi:hypothetical protein